MISIVEALIFPLGFFCFCCSGFIAGNFCFIECRCYPDFPVWFSFRIKSNFSVISCIFKCWSIVCIYLFGEFCQLYRILFCIPMFNGSGNKICACKFFKLGNRLQKLYHSNIFPSSVKQLAQPMLRHNLHFQQLRRSQF